MILPSIQASSIIAQLS